MMKTYFSLLLLTISLSASAQNSNSLVLKGDVSKVKEPIEQVMLLHDHKADSALVVNGKYNFKIEIKGPLQGLLRFRKKKGVTPEMTIMDNYQYRLYLEPGLMTVTSTNAVTNVKTTGSKWDDDFQIYNTRVNVLMASLKQGTDLVKKAVAAKDTLNAKRLSKEYAQMAKDGFRKMNLDFVSEFPNSLMLFTALDKAAGSPFNGDLIKPVFDKLPLSVQNSAKGKELKEKIVNSMTIGIGKMAPEFSQPDAAGKMVSLSSFKGKYVFLEFWANWCGFCRLEAPFMKKAYEKYKNKGFTILSVSVDTKADRDKWLKAIQDDGTSAWTQVADLKGYGNDAARLFAVRSYPSSYLIDPTGKIVAMDLRGDALVHKLEELLPE